MKISCTTLGCPGWTLDQILKQLSDSGYDGIDFRGLGDEMHVWKLPEFSTDVERTAKRIADAGLEVSAFSSGARMFLAKPEARPAALDEVAQYVKLCRQFKTKIIRVFGGGLGDTPMGEAIDASVEMLKRMSDAAGEDATLAVETHDDWIHTAPLGEVMAKTARKNVGVLWDMHHPYRMGGESPKQTWDNIGKFTVATHIKDSRVTGKGKHGFEYCLAGEGDVPLEEMIDLLKSGGYDDYLTLEWEKKWHPELPGAELALPSYAKFLRSMID